jgi:hypothetical protein
MPRTTDLHDNVIEWLSDADRATVTAHKQSLKHRLTKLAEENPDDVQIVAVNEDGTMVAHIPVSYILIRKPKQMNYTDEQKEANAKRLAEALAKKRAEASAQRTI